MSFNYEDIKDEVYLKMAKAACGMDYVWVTPKEFPPNYPLKKSSLESICLSSRYKKWAEKYKSFEVYEDDIWLVTYPKSGTTWSQEMIYLLKNDLNYEKAASATLNERFPFLELEATLDFPIGFSPFEAARDLPRPRLIKTHLPIQLLPDRIWTVNPKIIYVYREPKDVAVSYFHHYSTLNNYLGGIKEFVDCFVNDFLLWSPYHEHVSNYLELSEIKSNVLLSRYEDMQKDLSQQIKRTAKFLGVTFSDQQILVLADHLSIEKMRKNPAVNFEREAKAALFATNRFNSADENLNFIRKGQVGGWKNELTSEMAQSIDDWSNKKKYFLSEKF